MEEVMPDVYKQLHKILKKLEKHYKDMQDVEFTVENKKLWILQTRSGKRTAEAAIKIAVDMVKNKLINKKEMIHAMWVVSFLCSISGVSLIYFGTLGLNIVKIALFCFLGLSAMFAAMKYTMGKNPYGYSGFGDLFVFLFFFVWSALMFLCE